MTTKKNPTGKEFVQSWRGSYSHIFARDSDTALCGIARPKVNFSFPYAGGSPVPVCVNCASADKQINS